MLVLVDGRGKISESSSLLESMSVVAMAAARFSHKLAVIATTEDVSEGQKSESVSAIACSQSDWAVCVASMSVSDMLVVRRPVVWPTL